MTAATTTLDGALPELASSVPCGKPWRAANQRATASWKAWMSPLFVVILARPAASFVAKLFAYPPRGSRLAALAAVADLTVTPSR